MAKSMKDIWKMMERQHGSEGLFVGNQEMTTYSDVISTGSYALDDALGIWGLPRGRAIQLAGFESSGKTLLALTTVAEWQKKDPKNWGLFIDAEFTFDAKWAESLGVDVSRLYVYRENKAAAIFDRLTGIPAKRSKDGTLKKTKPGILDLEVETGGTGLGIIVLDSLATIQPPQEEASRAGKDNIALIARFLPPVLRNLTPMLSKTGVLFIAINQIRFQPGVMYGDPTTSSGGMAWKHACSTVVNLGMIKKAESYTLDEEKERIGHRIRARITKNKLAPPFRVSEFDIIYTKGIVNREEEVRDIGVRYGIIARPNNRSWVMDEQKYDKNSIITALQDEELQNSVFERAKQAKMEGRGRIIPEKDKENIKGDCEIEDGETTE